MIQRVPALHGFWDLEKTALQKIHVSGTVGSPYLWSAWVYSQKTKISLGMFLTKNLSNFVSLPWKLDNPSYHDPEQENENESAVIQVIKLADDQLKDIVKYWQTTTTSSTNRISITSTNSEPSKDQVPQVSFL